jgi:hypothetical protein
MNKEHTSSKFILGKEKADSVMSELKQITINTMVTLPEITCQFQKNMPTDFNKWKQNIILDINVSSTIGYYGIAPSWMRRYLNKKAL